MTSGYTTNKKAVITCTIGDEYFNQWNEFFRESWEHWCHKNNYDLIIFKDFIENDDSFKEPRSPAWQKLLAMAHNSLEHYEHALWIDSDIFINPSSPDPLQHQTDQTIGMTIDNGSPLSPEPEWFTKKWKDILNVAPSIIEEFGKFNREFNGYYDLWGMNSLCKKLYNTGVILFQPEAHNQYFTDIYHQWPDGGKGALHEMVPLNLCLSKHNIIRELDYRFNVLFGVHYAVYQRLGRYIDDFENFNSKQSNDCIEFLSTILTNSHFIHFAGCHDLMYMLFKHEEYKEVFTQLMKYEKA